MFAALAVAVLLAVAPPAMASRALETITVPVKRADNATSATFKTKVKEDRLYAVRFSGSFRIEDTSWDPAYCFDGDEECANPSPSVVAVVQQWRRVRGEEPMYASALNFFDGRYPAYRADHTYTLPFKALFHTQVRTAACPFTNCDDAGSLEARLLQRPFPEGFLHLWGEDCRDGARYDSTITVSAGECERVRLSGESGPRPGGALWLQRKRDKWKNVGETAGGAGEFPTATLGLKNGRGTDKFRAVLVRDRGRIVKRSNVLTIHWVG